LSGLRVSHAAEANVIRPCFGLSFAAPTRNIAGAILIGAKKGASAVNALPDPRLTGIETIRRFLWIDYDFYAGCQSCVIVGAIPV
jgi:hypothetical protein